MYTFAHPVKAGIILFMVFSLVLSTVAPTRIAIAQGVFPSLSDFSTLPQVNLTVQGCPPLNSQFSAQYYLPGKIKVSLIGQAVFCEDQWQVLASNHEFAGSVGFAFKAIQLEGQAGENISLTIDTLGNATIETGATIFKHNGESVDGSISYSTDLGIVWKAKWTKKYEDVIDHGLDISISVIVEKKADIEGDANIDPQLVPAVTYSAAMGVFFFVLLKGETAAAVAAQATSNVVPVIMTDEQFESIKDFMRRTDPSYISQVQAYTPQSVELPYAIYNATIKKYGSIEPATGLLSAPSQVQPAQAFNFSGSGFAPGGQVVVSFVMNPYDDTVTKITTADSSGNIQGSITLPSADQMMSGTYLLSAADATSAYYGAKALLENADATAQIYIASALVEVVGGTADSNPDTNYNPPTVQDLNCDRVRQHDIKLGYLFSGTNCGGDLTWFSGHPENGPSANSFSLYVPANSVVKVSSNDGGGGETACFSSTQEDLGSWKNKIQWVQVIPGGSCPPPPAGDRYVVHTNQGDFTVSVGQTWDNTQHNRQILGFDRHGSAHLKINHVNGAQRCWDDTKSAQQLQNDGDWWIQTRSIEIGSGYCPGMSGQLQIFNLANFQGSQNDIRAGNSRTYPNNDLKYSFRFTEPGMSAKFTAADGRTRCWNTNVSNLQDHEDYWHRTVKIEVFGNDVCPRPVEVPEGANFAPGSNVKYSYYEYTSPFAGLPIPSSWTPVRTGSAGNFAINQVPHRDNDFAIRFESCLSVPTEGTYTFYTTSDDGSELYITGQKVVDNDGYHGNSEKLGTMYLTAGIHPITVDFFEGGVDQILGVSWQGPGFGKQWLPNSALNATDCSFEVPEEAQYEPGTGVAYKYYEFTGGFPGLPVPNTWVPVRTGAVGNFAISHVGYRADNFAIAFSSCLNVPTTGAYTFAISSDDGSELYIDGQTVVDNDGFHSKLEKSGTINLTSGLHAIGAQYFEGLLHQALNVYWEGPGFTRQRIPNQNLSIGGCSWNAQVETEAPPQISMLAIAKTGLTAGTIGMQLLDGSSFYNSALANYTTPNEEDLTPGYRWAFELGPFNSDGILDLYAIKKNNTASGRTEIHVLSGAHSFSSYLLQTGIPMGYTGVDLTWDYELGDYNRDGKVDVYAMSRRYTGTGTTEVHILNGATNFQSFLFHSTTPIPPVGSEATWDLELGDYNSDGHPDLYAFNKVNTASGNIEVTVINGPNFSSIALHTAVALTNQSIGTARDVELADYNKDGKHDLFLIDKEGSNGFIKVTVLDGTTNFQAELASFTTMRPSLPSGDTSWMFRFGVFPQAQGAALPDESVATGMKYVFLPLINR